MVTLARSSRLAFSSSEADSGNVSSRAMEELTTVGIEDTPASAEGASEVGVVAFGTVGAQGSTVGPLFVMIGSPTLGATPASAEGTLVGT